MTAAAVPTQGHPFCAWCGARKDWEPSWNFNTVLIGHDGAIAGLSPATEEPDSPKLRGARAEMLAAAA
jgi:hypothetical protein